MAVKNDIKKIDDFIEKYKMLETAVKDSDKYSDVGYFITEMRNSADPEERNIGDKLLLCMAVRNYITHNSDGYSFCAVTDAMTSLLEETAMSLSPYVLYVKELKVKKLAIPYTATIKEAAELLNKAGTGWLPFLGMDGTVDGIITDRMIVKYMSEARSKIIKTIPVSAYVKEMSDAIVIDENEEASKLIGYKRIIVTKNKNYKGIVI